MAGGVAPVVDDDACEGARLAQIHLPPRRLGQAGVEAPLAVLDAVHRPGSILLGRHRGGAHAAEPFLQKPIGLDLRAEPVFSSGSAARAHDGNNR